MSLGHGEGGINRGIFFSDSLGNNIERDLGISVFTWPFVLIAVSLRSFSPNVYKDRKNDDSFRAP
jgi:hypothetical protein